MDIYTLAYKNKVITADFKICVVRIVYSIIFKTLNNVAVETWS